VKRGKLYTFSPGLPTKFSNDALIGIPIDECCCPDVCLRRTKTSSPSCGPSGLWACQGQTPHLVDHMGPGHATQKNPYLKRTKSYSRRIHVLTHFGVKVCQHADHMGSGHVIGLLCPVLLWIYQSVWFFFDSKTYGHALGLGKVRLSALHADHLGMMRAYGHAKGRLPRLWTIWAQGMPPKRTHILREPYLIVEPISWPMLGSGYVNMWTIWAQGMSWVFLCPVLLWHKRKFSSFLRVRPLGMP